MGDLIDRQAAIDAIRIFYADECALVDSIEEQLEKLPSAQPQHIEGRWIDTGRCLRWECSNCGRRDHHIYNYCPDCGARMRNNKGEWN